jgi:hypothetical protein
MRFRLVYVGLVLAVLSLGVALVAQAPPRLPVLKTQAAPTKVIPHQAGRLDAIGTSGGQGIRAVDRPPVQAVSVPYKPLSDAEKLALLQEAAGKIGASMPPLTGVMTKARLTPRQPFATNQALIRMATQGSFVIHDSVGDTGMYMMQNIGDTSTLYIMFEAFKPGQPVLVTLDIAVVNSQTLRFCGTGFDMQIAVNPGRQTLSTVVMTQPGTNEVMVRAIRTAEEAGMSIESRPHKEWWFYGADLTVLK